MAEISVEADACAFPLLPPARDRDSLVDRIGASLLMMLPHLDFDSLRDEVLAVGSLVEGLGNALSDLDIFILSETQERAKGARFFWIDADIWVDVGVVTHSRAADLALELSDASRQPSPDWGDMSCLTWKELDLCHRLAFAVRLTDPVQPHLERINISRQALCREVAVGFMIPARARWLDGVGALRSGHVGQAAHCGRIALNYAVEAYCAMHGQTNPNNKWRLAKAARLKDDPLHCLKRLADAPSGYDCASAEHLLNNASEMIFHASHFFTQRSLAHYPALLSVTERYEMQGPNLFRIDDHDRLYPAPEMAKELGTLTT